MREVYPVKYYKDEGFVERKIEIHDEDLERIIEEYLLLHAEFDFDEIEIVNNRPMNVWLHAKCRKYIDPEAPEEDQVTDAEVQVSGKYDATPRALRGHSNSAVAATNATERILRFVSLNPFLPFRPTHQAFTLDKMMKTRETRNSRSRRAGSGGRTKLDRVDAKSGVVRISPLETSAINDRLSVKASDQRSYASVSPHLS